MRRRRFRARRFLLRAGRVTCLLLAVAWLSSMKVSVGYVAVNQSLRTTFVGVEHGCLAYTGGTAARERRKWRLSRARSRLLVTHTQPVYRTGWADNGEPL